VRKAHSGAGHHIGDGAVHAQTGSGQSIPAAKRDSVVIAQFDGYAA
jgi:hypothetical protein